MTVTGDGITTLGMSLVCRENGIENEMDVGEANRNRCECGL